MEKVNLNQIEYYASRAGEYEKIYEKPERQANLEKIKVKLKKWFKGQTVYEIACGTGYWTQIISESAQAITATDINDQVLEIARHKNYNTQVVFQKTDIFHIPKYNEDYNAGFGGFIWSHIPKQDLYNFLKNFMKNIASGGTIVFLDNQFSEGSSTPVNKFDDYGNSYQIRQLLNGKKYEVMKNFPTDSEITQEVKPFAVNIKIVRWQYYWLLEFIKH